MRCAIFIAFLCVPLNACSKKSGLLDHFNPSASSHAPQPAQDVKPLPLPVVPDEPWTTHPGGRSSLTAGEHHTCVLAEGSVHCWGYGLTGQLGQGHFQNHAEPAAVKALGHDNVAIAAGDLHTCAVKQSGDVYCWGYNQTGAVGNGRSGREFSFSGQAKLANVANPTRVQGLDGLGITQVAATKTTTCALTVTGEVYCWGSGSSYQLGDGVKDSEQNRLGHHTGIARKANVLVERILKIHGGDRGFCAITESHKTLCWGTLALPTEKAHPLVDLSTGRLPLSLSMADQHACFLTEDHQLHCMGDNWYQQSGLASVTHVWTRVSGEAFTRIATARKTTCGITPSRTVRCWGVCLHGLCGDQFDAKLITPTQPQNVFAYSTQKSIEISGISGAVDLSVGARHACALLDSGRIKCWGNGFLGELGNGDSQASAEPVDVTL